MENVTGLKIAYYRKSNGFTLKELAEKVGVSSQAVLKWEKQRSCPDIMLLPKLANIFGITIDKLFGISNDKETAYRVVGNVPWNDDGKLRIAIYSGRELMEQSEHICSEGENLINLQFHGEQYNVNGVCKVSDVNADKE